MLVKETKESLISIAICDDEILTCLDVEKKVNDIFFKRGINHTIKIFYSGKELVTSNEKFDIILLDIKMDKLNGIETAQKLRENNCDSILIFITIDPEYVYKAFEVEAFHYILKPIDNEKLEHTLLRAINKILSSHEEFIVISQNRQNIKLMLSEIMYFEVAKRIIKVHSSNYTYEFYERLNVLEDKIQNEKFFRCHRSYLINLLYVSKVERNEVTLENGEKIPLSKRRYEEFSKVFFAFMRKEGGIL